MQHPCYTVFEQQLRNIDWATTVALDVAFIVIKCKFAKRFQVQKQRPNFASQQKIWIRYSYNKLDQPAFIFYNEKSACVFTAFIVSVQNEVAIKCV